MAAAPDLKPVYLLTGSDRPKIETALARLRRHFQPEAVELVTAQEVSGADAAALCNVGSLFGDARLVVIEGVDGRRNADGRLANGWKVADVKAVEEYLSSPAPGTVLALVAEELKKDAPLTKACAKAGDVLAFEVAKRNVANWVAERFKQAGARAEPDACAALVAPGRGGLPPARERDRQARALGRRRADRPERGGAPRRRRGRDADVRPHRRLGAARRRQ